MEVFIVGIIFGSFVAVILGPSYFKSRERLRMQDNLHLAIEKGQPLPSDVIDAVARSADVLPVRTRDVRRAVILLALAAAFAVIGLIAKQFSWDPHANMPNIMWSIATIPGFVGLAYLTLALINKNKN